MFIEKFEEKGAISFVLWRLEVIVIILILSLRENGLRKTATFTVMPNFYSVKLYSSLLLQDKPFRLQYYMMWHLKLNVKSRRCMVIICLAICCCKNTLIAQWVSNTLMTPLLERCLISRLTDGSVFQVLGFVRLECIGNKEQLQEWFQLLLAVYFTLLCRLSRMWRGVSNGC